MARKAVDPVLYSRTRTVLGRPRRVGSLTIRPLVRLRVAAVVAGPLVVGPLVSATPLGLLCRWRGSRGEWLLPLVGAGLLGSGVTGSPGGERPDGDPATP